MAIWCVFFPYCCAFFSACLLLPWRTVALVGYLAERQMPASCSLDGRRSLASLQVWQAGTAG